MAECGAENGALTLLYVGSSYVAGCGSALQALVLHGITLPPANKPGKGNQDASLKH